MLISTRAALFVLLGSLVACGGSTTPDGGAESGVDTGTGPGDLGVDAHCDTDSDADGHRSIMCGGDDCNDADPDAYPGNPERCDAAGHDEDCDPATLGPDADFDGFAGTGCCNVQRGAPMRCGTDCDDARATISPSAVEACNMMDDDCDSMTDEGVINTYYPDCDGDAHGDPSRGVTACAAPTAAPTCTAGGPGMWLTVGDDCDDASAAAHPGVVETCNGVDDDCDGMIDESGRLYAPDCDADGFGATGATTVDACTTPSIPATCAAGGTGWSAVVTDCDDVDGAIHPGATDACSGVDENCDGVIDGPECPECMTYCALLQAACAGGFAAFATEADCVADCLTRTPSDRSCRESSIPAAQTMPSTYCPCMGTGACSVSCG